jgi:hypothetical protein
MNSASLKYNSLTRHVTGTDECYIWGIKTYLKYLHRTQIPSVFHKYRHNVRPLFYQIIIGYASCRLVYRVKVLYSFDSPHDREQ